MIQPMLCQTGNLKDLSRQGYIGEHKYDGTRCLIIKENRIVTLQNRHGIIYTHRLPELVTAGMDIPGDFTIDGEVVFINHETGRIEFTPCQRRCSTSDFARVYFLQQQFPIVFMAFDMIKCMGENVTQRRLLERKNLLRNLLATSPDALKTIRYVPHRHNLEPFFEEVRKQEGEGIIIKDLNSRYQHERSYSWLKIKNWRFEICDIAGYTPGQNARHGLFGSLVLARNGRFRGCVGSGFNDRELRKIKDMLTDAPKISRPFDIREPYFPVKTSLQVEVKYYQATENGVLRFPVFVKTI